MFYVREINKTFFPLSYAYIGNYSYEIVYITRDKARCQCCQDIIIKTLGT